MANVPNMTGEGHMLVIWCKKKWPNGYHQLNSNNLELGKLG